MTAIEINRAKVMLDADRREYSGIGIMLEEIAEGKDHHKNLVLIEPPSTKNKKQWSIVVSGKHVGEAESFYEATCQAYEKFKDGKIPKPVKVPAIHV